MIGMASVPVKGTSPSDSSPAKEGLDCPEPFLIWTKAVACAVVDGLGCVPAGRRSLEPLVFARHGELPGGRRVGDPGHGRHAPAPGLPTHPTRATCKTSS